MLYRQTASPVVGIFVLLAVMAPLVSLLVVRVSPAVSLAIVVGIVIFILSFISTQFAIYILIFATLLSPQFGSRTTHGSGITLRLDDLLLLVIGFSQLTKAAVHREVGLFSRTPLNRYITYYILACVFSTGVGIIFGRVKGLSGMFFVLKYFEYFIVYFMTSNNLDSKSRARHYLLAIFLTATIVSLVAIAQIPEGRRVAAPFEGEHGEPNTLGGYLLLISSVVGGILLTRNAAPRFSIRAGLVFLLVLMFVPILFTLSRATWIATVPAFLTFVLLGKRKMPLVLLAVISLAAAPFFLPNAVKKRIFYTVRQDQSSWARAQQETIAGVTFDTSSSARIRSWEDALHDFPRHPILGFGITGWRFIDAQYLRVLLETGIVGFATFVMLLRAIIRQTWYTYKQTSDPLFRGVAFGFLAGTFGLMMHATMTNTFIIVRIMEPFCLLLAIVVAAPTLEKDREAPAPAAAPGLSGPPGEPGWRLRVRG